MQSAKERRDNALSRAYRYDENTRHVVRAITPGLTYMVTRTKPLGHVHHVNARTCDEAMTKVLKKEKK